MPQIALVGANMRNTSYAHTLSYTLKSFIIFTYTLSHPENDCDVTERTQGYTLQDASFMR